MAENKILQYVQSTTYADEIKVLRTRDDEDGDGNTLSKGVKQDKPHLQNGSNSERRTVTSRRKTEQSIAVG